MSATLAATATSLETHAGASTSANPNEPGYWQRIAAAAESLAGAGTSANANQMGSMKRAAVALESIAGTSGAEENTNEAGYKKRIVDALEVQAGAVTVGSLDYRMMVAAENAEFTPEPGPELWPQPEFDAATGLTLVGGASVVAGKLEMDGDGNCSAQATAVATVVAGTVHYAVKIDATGGEDLITISTGGGLLNIPGSDSPGVFEGTFETPATDQFMLIRGIDVVATIDYFRVHQ